MIDYTRALDTTWYNSFQRAPDKVFENTNRSTFRGHPASAATLHGYETFGEEIKCGVYVKIKDNYVGIPYTSKTAVSFSIGGGAEIPHFCLKLCLQPPEVTDERVKG